MDGAYIAQKGRFGRRYYLSGSHVIKSRLERYGMIASNLVPVTAWMDGGGVVEHSVKLKIGILITTLTETHLEKR